MSPLGVIRTVRAMRQVSRDFCSVPLAMYGFRERSGHFYRQSGDLFHGIHFQASRYGTRTTGNFTVNLVITSPSLYGYWTGGRLPPSPANALWPIHFRIGFLCPESRDLWWAIDPDTDISAVAEDVKSRLVQYALTFFLHYPHSDALLQAIETGSLPTSLFIRETEFVHAMLLVDRGQRKKAASVLQIEATSCNYPPRQELVLKIADRLGIHLKLSTVRSSDSGEVGRKRSFSYLRSRLLGWGGKISLWK